MVTAIKTSGFCAFSLIVHLRKTFLNPVSNSCEAVRPHAHPCPLQIAHTWVFWLGLLVTPYQSQAARNEKDAADIRETCIRCFVMLVNWVKAILE